MRPGIAAPAVGVLACSVLVGLAPAVEAAKAPRCVKAKDQVAATLGLWDGSIEPDRYSDPGPSVDLLATGLGKRELAAAVTDRRGGRVRAVQVCSERTRILRLPRPPGDARIGGISLNGRYVAWRVWQPGRAGQLLVGRKERGRLVAIRRTTVPRLTSTFAVDGRIVVLPTGEAAWSVRVGKRSGVWLWPRGRPAKQIAVAPAPGKDDRDGIRIVDPRHVLVMRTATVARYGSATPGRCPRTFLSAQRTLGSSVVSSLSLAHFPVTSFEDDYDYTTLVCDRQLGEYTAVNRTRGSSNLHDYRSTAVRFAASTAGTMVLQEASSSNVGGGTSTYGSVVVAPGRPGELFRAYGTVGGSAIDVPAPTATSGAAPQRRTVQMVPGAVAWVGSTADPDESPAALDVFVADAGGTRVVGSIPGSALFLSGTDPELTLTPTALSWTGASGRRTVAVRPRPDDPVQTTTLPTPGLG